MRKNKKNWPIKRRDICNDCSSRMRRKCCLHDQPTRWTPRPTVTVCDSAAAAGPETPSGLGVGGTPAGRVSHTPWGSGGSTQATCPAPPSAPTPGTGVSYQEGATKKCFQALHF